MTETKLNPVAKTVTNWMGYILIAIAATLTVTTIVAQALPAKEALTPLAERTYQAAMLTKCNAEKALVQAKLSDYGNGLLELTPDDVKRLAEKKNMECQNKGF